MLVTKDVSNNEIQSPTSLSSVTYHNLIGFEVWRSEKKVFSRNFCKAHLSALHGS